jgi:hypothetical protein
MSDVKIIQIVFRGDIMFGLANNGNVYRQVLTKYNVKDFSPEDYIKLPSSKWVKELDSVK